MSCEPYPSHHNGLFSPLLILRDFAAREADQYRSAPLQVPGSTLTGRVICGRDLAECVSVPGDFLRPPGDFSPGFYTLQRRGHRLGPETPEKGECQRGCRHFWECQARAGSGPAPAPKKALCHTCPLGGATNKYRRSISVLSKQYKTSYLFYVTLSFMCYIICFY